MLTAGGGGKGGRSDRGQKSAHRATQGRPCLPALTAPSRTRMFSSTAVLVALAQHGQAGCLQVAESAAGGIHEAAAVKRHLCAALQQHVGV